MKKHTILLLLAGAMLAVFSCKKPSSPSAASNLEGKWKISKVYEDTNRNGIMDANELITDTAFNNYISQFNSNGTIVSTYYGVIQSTGFWSLIDNNTYIQIKDTTFGTTTYTYDNIISLTSTSMEIKDTTGVASGMSYTTWEFFTKQ